MKPVTEIPRLPPTALDSRVHGPLDRAAADAADLFSQLLALAVANPLVAAGGLLALAALVGAATERPGSRADTGSGNDARAVRPGGTPPVVGRKGGREPAPRPARPAPT